MSRTPPPGRLNRAVGGLALLSGITLSCSLSIWLLRFMLAAWTSPASHTPLSSWLPVALFLLPGIYLSMHGWRGFRGAPLGLWRGLELLLGSVVAWILLYFGFLDPVLTTWSDPAAHAS